MTLGSQIAKPEMKRSMRISPLPALHYAHESKLKLEFENANCSYYDIAPEQSTKLQIICYFQPTLYKYNINKFEAVQAMPASKHTRHC